MIQVSSISKSFGQQELFNDLSFTLSKGEKVGLLGRNGSGKSTLFKILLNEESCDSGVVTIPKKYRIGHLHQHLHFTTASIIEECMLSFSEEEKSYKKYEAEKILFGLGFIKEDLEKSPHGFSGGQQIRINLAKVLVQDPDCLLLDEPTNYLDIVSLRWLSSFLKSFHGEVMLITHDRGFMDEVCTHMMGIWRNKLIKVQGNSEHYFEKITQEEERHEKTRLSIERKRKELQHFVDRFKAKATKASQARSRQKQMDRLATLESLGLVETLAFRFTFQECPGKVLMEIKDLEFSYPHHKIIKSFNEIILKQDKIAIIGKNGKGKSTLLNLLAGELKEDDGEIKKNPNLLLGHFGQTNIQRLNLDNTIEEEILSANPLMSIQRVRSLAGIMMFSGDLVQKKISVLSGGERSRVLLAKILARPTNLLLLDEPTNHLDQESVEALMIELQNYPGAVIFVSHSEEMLKNVAEKLIIFQNQMIEVFNGTYDEFLEKVGWNETDNLKSPQAKVQNSSSQNSIDLNRKDLKRLRSELIMQRSKELKPLKKQMEILENEITYLENEEKVLERMIIELGVKGESQKIQESSIKLSEVKNRIENAFDELTEISLEHDEIKNRFEKLIE